MKNWKHVAILALAVGLGASVYAQGSGQGKMYKHGANGTQPSGQGAHQGGGQGNQARTQTRIQDGSHIGGEEALRERMRTQTHTPVVSTPTTTAVTE